MRSALVLLSVTMLLSCANPDNPETLEDKAKAGDPEASCALVVQDLQMCMVAREQWVNNPSSTRPLCLDNPIPNAHRDYWATSAKWVGPGGKKAAGVFSDGAALIVTMLQTNVLTKDHMKPLVQTVADACAALRN